MAVYIRPALYLSNTTLISLSSPPREWSVMGSQWDQRDIKPDLVQGTLLRFCIKSMINFETEIKWSNTRQFTFYFGWFTLDRIIVCNKLNNYQQMFKDAGNANTNVTLWCHLTKFGTTTEAVVTTIVFFFIEKINKSPPTVQTSRQSYHLKSTKFLFFSPLFQESTSDQGIERCQVRWAASIWNLWQ